MFRRRFLGGAAVCVVVMLAMMFVAAARADFGRGGGPVELPESEEATDHNVGESAPLSDPANLLRDKLDDGEVSLEYEDGQGYLKSLLKELDIPVSSQVMVFSQTSLQRRKISPKTPRAIYFNDDVYVGYVQNGPLEILSIDAVRGATFFTVDQDKTQPARLAPDETNCMQCHHNGRTLNVPGPVVRSVFAEPDGTPVFRFGTHDVDHTTPLTKRWGGWYVTGTHGEVAHMGNAFVADGGDEALDRTKSLNVTDLSGYFDTSKYLSPHSDIVALLTLDHQVYMHNVITRAGYEGRRALHHNRVMNEALEEPVDQMLDSTLRRLDRAADAVVEVLLFAGQATFGEPVKGTTTFVKDFAARGPHDAKGRTLREFDLKRGLFEYPCSFLIYAPAFDALPDEVRTRVYQQLYDVLTGDGATEDDRFAHLSTETRQTILEILRDTKKQLPAYWHEAQ